MPLGRDNRVRLTIVSGFLGAGKTTFLQHLLNTTKHRTSHVIVNEAAEYSIDDFLLQKARVLTKIAGGCVCCTQKSQFLKVLKEICNLRTRKTVPEADRIDNILLETSGISDPRSIYDCIVNDPVLVRNILVEETMVLIDAFSDLEALNREQLVKKQIVSADKILVSKPDLVEVFKINEIFNFVQSLNSSATINCSVKGEIRHLTHEESLPRKLLLNKTTKDTKSIEQINTAKIPIKSDMDWNSLVIWLSALLYCHGHDFLRVKGIVSAPSGKLLIQGVGNHIQKPQRLPNDFPSEKDYLVLIGRNINENKILESISLI